MASLSSGFALILRAPTSALNTDIVALTIQHDKELGNPSTL
jgi:hypothetical protein